MSRIDFITTFILQNYQVMGLERVISDSLAAADAIYGGAA